MSLVNACRATIKLLFSGDTKRLIITTNYGLELIKNSVTQKELLDMEILGIFLLGDNGIFDNPDLNTHEVIFFVEDESNINDIYTTLPLCKANVCIHFYTPVTSDIARRIKIFDVNNIVCTVTSYALSIIPVSNHCAVSNKASILATMRYRPKKIAVQSGNTSDPLYKKTLSKINECASVSSIFERQNYDNSMLVALERSYDKIIPLLIPWRYESMLHYHKIKLQNYSGHSTDEFFIKNAYELYENVIRNIEIEKQKMETKISSNKSNKTASIASVASVQSTKFTESTEFNKPIKPPKPPTTQSAISILEQEKSNKMINKHIIALNQLSSLIKEEDVFVKSEEEQMAIIRKLSEEQKTQFKINRPVIAEAIYKSKPGSTSSNIIYYNYVPKIRLLIQKYINENPEMSEIYFYVGDYICYEEVAEVELFNKSSSKKIYLLSDSILDQWNYLASTYKNMTIEKPFKINKLISVDDAIVKKQNGNKSKLDDVQEKITKLESFPVVTFDEKIEKEQKSLSVQVSTMLMKEYDRLKIIIPTNKIEENNKNMEMMKLNKLTTRFKQLEQREKAISNRSNFPNYFDKIDQISEFDEETSYDRMKQSHDDGMTELLINQRGESIQNITQGIFDINKLSLELLLVVQEQALKLDTIEVNLLSSVELVKKGAEHIEEANNLDSSSMGLQQKIAFGLGVIATALMTGAGFKIANH